MRIMRSCKILGCVDYGADLSTRQLAVLKQSLSDRLYQMPVLLNQGDSPFAQHLVMVRQARRVFIWVVLEENVEALVAITLTVTPAHGTGIVTPLRHLPG